MLAGLEQSGLHGFAAPEEARSTYFRIHHTLQDRSSIDFFFQESDRKTS